MKHDSKDMSSIEQLQKDSIRIPGGLFLLLISVIVLTCAFFAWGFLGKIPEYATGRGAIVLDNRFWLIYSNTDGVVDSVKALNGVKVRRGDSLAVIGHEDMDIKIDSKKEEISKLKSLISQKKSWDSKKSALEKNSYSNQRENLKKTIALSERRVKEMNAQLKDYEELLEKRYISISQYSALKGQYNQLLESLTNQKAQLDSLPINRLNNTTDRESDLDEQNIRLLNAERELELMIAERGLKSVVKAPMNATVVQSMVVDGSKVQNGDVLFQLEYILDDAMVKDIKNNKSADVISACGPSSLDVSALRYDVAAFIESDNGSSVKEGMEVSLVPAYLKEEESGALKGVVLQASGRFSSRAEAERFLNNPELANLIWSANNDYYLVTIKLIRDSRGNFVWTSKKSFERPVNIGALTSVEIKLYEKNPISLVIPYLKNTLLGVGK